MGTMIFVGNLSLQASEQDLRAAFAADGRRVARVRILLCPRGFAFVEMATESDATAAIAALHGLDFQGRGLRVTRARDEPRRKWRRSTRRP